MAVQGQGMADQVLHVQRLLCAVHPVALSYEKHRFARLQVYARVLSPEVGSNHENGRWYMVC